MTEYVKDVGDYTPSESKNKVPIPLTSLTSVKYSKSKMEEDNEFFMRLVFEDSHRPTLDIKLRNKEDWEYCMSGFELVSKNREYLAEMVRKASGSPAKAAPAPAPAPAPTPTTQPAPAASLFSCFNPTPLPTVPDHVKQAESRALEVAAKFIAEKDNAKGKLLKMLSSGKLKKEKASKMQAPKRSGAPGIKIEETAHRDELDDIFKRLQTSKTGLSDTRATELLSKWGPNRMTLAKRGPKPSTDAPWVTALQTCTVVRDGVPSSVMIENIVPGDVIFVLEDMPIPADARVLATLDAKSTMDKVALTGEVRYYENFHKGMGRIICRSSLRKQVRDSMMGMLVFSRVASLLQIIIEFVSSPAISSLMRLATLVTGNADPDFKRLHGLGHARDPKHDLQGLQTARRRRRSPRH